jgi:CHRD domain
MLSPRVLLIVLLFFPIGAIAIADEAPNCRANLSGAGMMPPVSTPAHGEVLFWISQDGQSVRYRLSVADIQNLTFAHLHSGRADAPGPVVAWLYPEGPPPKLISGMFTGVVAERSLQIGDLLGPLQGRSVGDLIAALKAGNTYVNVHSNRYSAGEIGGQVE